MKLASVLLVFVWLIAGPAGAQGTAEHSLDAADTGRSESPDQAPDAAAAQPDDVVGAGTEQDTDSDSLDSADTGASATSDQVEASDAQAPEAAPPPLPPAPPITDGDYAAQADAAAAGQPLR